MSIVFCKELFIILIQYIIQSIWHLVQLKPAGDANCDDSSVCYYDSSKSLRVEAKISMQAVPYMFDRISDFTMFSGCAATVSCTSHYVYDPAPELDVMKYTFNTLQITHSNSGVLFIESRIIPMGIHNISIVIITNDIGAVRGKAGRIVAAIDVESTVFNTEIVMLAIERNVFDLEGVPMIFLIVCPLNYI